MTMQTLPRRLGAAVVTAAIVWFLSVKLNTFRDYQIAEVGVYVTAVAGLTVLTGLSGQISLGNGAFMAIGGYTTALLLLHLNWPYIAALVASAAVTALAGVLVSPSTFLYPNSMDAIFVLGFTAAVIGGLDSPTGAVVGGLLLGLALSYAGGYLHSGASLVPVVALGILVLVLMIRPDGLFSATQVRRV